MNVLIVNSMVPFLWGGAEELASHLQRQVEHAGHSAEILRIPFQWEPAARIPSQMLMARAFELGNVDRVIALKFPAYLVRHPHKTLWLLHQYRQAYDLFDAGETNLPADEQGDALRQAIRAADNETFAECRGIFTNSEVTQQRLKKYNGFDAQVLLPPVNDPERFPGGPGEGYIFAGGRINATKRQHLLLHALALAPAAVRLVIAGPPDSPEDATRLHRLVEQHGLADRVRLDLRFLPRQDYADYVNRAEAVAYLPFDEDSLGYVAMEAATARKALIATHDSGGILGLACHGETGWVAAPKAAALAEALTAVFQHPARTRDYGEAAHSRWQALGISWPQTIQRLLP